MRPSQDVCFIAIVSYQREVEVVWTNGQIKLV